MVAKQQDKVVIFNDSHGWHSAQLVRALASRGVATKLTDLAECAVDLDAPTGLIIPGFDNNLPLAAMVRGVASGSLEQITLRMDVLHTLARFNVPVLNSADAIEHTVDKARTSLKLHLAGIPTPQTWVCEDRHLARKITQQQLLKGQSLLVKPLFGSQGKGIEKIDNLKQFDNLNVSGDVFYLQHYIAHFGQQPQDWRLMVIDGHVTAAMLRRSQHWVTNVAQGANYCAVIATDTMRRLAIDAAHVVKADYAGVDLIRQKEGSYMVLEVNSVPAWKGLYQATGIAIAEKLADAIISRI